MSPTSEPVILREAPIKSNEAALQISLQRLKDLTERPAPQTQDANVRLMKQSFQLTVLDDNGNFIRGENLSSQLTLDQVGDFADKYKDAIGHVVAVASTPLHQTGN